MTKRDKEQLSAFMDGQTDDAAEVIATLTRDSDWRETWRRYHVIRDVLKRGYAPTAATLTQRIATRLQDEPVVIAPPSTHLSHSKPLLRTAGWAIAASIMLIMVVFFGSGLWQVDEEVSVVFSTDKSELPLNAEIERTLNDYIVNHNEYSASARIQGMMTYNRLVSYVPASSTASSVDRPE